MKKRLFGLVLAGLLCFSPVSAFAAEVTPITVSSGIDLYQEETESTFDSSRTIYGEAKPNTKVSVSVSCKDANGDMSVVSAQEVTVGSMGIFAATVGLEMGYNYVTRTGDKAGYEEASYTVVIKRLPKQLKKDLQNMIALPGLY